MRKLILKMSLSADGFVSGPNGELAWLFQSLDDESTKWEVETAWNASVHIMGSRTFADMKAYWPTSDEPFAPPMNEIPKVVFSRKGIPAATTRGLEEAMRLRDERGGRKLPAKTASWNDARVVTGDVTEVLRRMKQLPGKPILAHGGASFAQSLVKTGLIDEYLLLIHPVALGNGLRLFPPLSEPLRLRLAGTTSFPAGAVVNIYAPGSARRFVPRRGAVSFPAGGGPRRRGGFGVRGRDSHDTPRSAAGRRLLHCAVISAPVSSQ